MLTSTLIQALLQPMRPVGDTGGTNRSIAKICMLINHVHEYVEAYESAEGEVRSACRDNKYRGFEDQQKKPPGCSGSKAYLMFACLGNTICRSFASTQQPSWEVLLVCLLSIHQKSVKSLHVSKYQQPMCRMVPTGEMSYDSSFIIKLSMGIVWVDQWLTPGPGVVGLTCPESERWTLWKAS